MAFDLVPRNEDAIIPECHRPDPDRIVVVCGQKYATVSTRREAGEPTISFCTGNGHWRAVWDWVVTTNGIFTASEKRSGYTNNYTMVSSAQCLLLVKEMERYVAGGGKFMVSHLGPSGDGLEPVSDKFVQDILTFFRTSGGFQIA